MVEANNNHETCGCTIDRWKYRKKIIKFSNSENNSHQVSVDIYFKKYLAANC